MECLQQPVSLGARVFVASNLALTGTANASSELATAELSLAIEAWEGGGLVVLAGKLF
ncbi:MAG: hypothetical protein JWL70_3048, partial [Acidimicrobiia bacterium]|nr:hypothetical protein [Acidimicrobiia bacterium]